MAKPQPIADVVEEIFQSVLATPKRQRRLRSKTFWENFGFKMRTKERVEQVREALKQRSLIVNLDEIFGTEDKDEWVVLSFVEPPRPPAVIQDELPFLEVRAPTDQAQPIIHRTLGVGVGELCLQPGDRCSHSLYLCHTYTFSCAPRPQEPFCRTNLAELPPQARERTPGFALYTVATTHDRMALTRLFR